MQGSAPTPTEPKVVTPSGRRIVAEPALDLGQTNLQSHDAHRTRHSSDKLTTVEPTARS